MKKLSTKQKLHHNRCNARKQRIEAKRKGHRKAQKIIMQNLEKQLRRQVRQQSSDTITL